LGFLGTLPNRPKFKHGSGLKLIESFLVKVAKALLRGIRVASTHELMARIEL
jgi:hypothetical protein